MSNGLPFLDEFTDYDSVLRHFEAHGTLPFHNRGRSALAVAMVSHHLGRPEQARRYFDLADSEAAKHQGFRTHVAEVRGYCGL